MNRVHGQIFDIRYNIKNKTIQVPTIVVPIAELRLGWADGVNYQYEVLTVHNNITQASGRATLVEKDAVLYYGSISITMLRFSKIG